MQQESWFYESFLAALREDCKAISPGRGWAKDLGSMLFPEKTDPEQAARALDDRLNPDRRERFTDEQTRMIMRKAREACGFSAALAYICDDTGFERPKAVAPRDEAADLQRRAERMVVELKQILDRQERLTRPPLTGITGGR